MANDTLQEYINFLQQRSATNFVNSPTAAAPADVNADVNADWATWYKEKVGISDVDEVTSMNAALDFFGNVAWGGVSGLTWGAAGFVKEEKKWDEMNDWEKAGWVTGEGLSLFAPFVGPFAIIGRGGRAATKLFRANKYVTSAAKDLIKTDTLIAKGIVDGATKSGALDNATAKILNRELEKNLPKALKGREAVRALRGLDADVTTSVKAIKYLERQSAGVARKIFTDSGQEFGPGAARTVGKLYVKGLKEGRYVNDIGEWVTRTGLNGQNPGNIRKYLGMFAQDALYMGLHAVGVEKIDSMVHMDEYNPLKDTNADYSQIPMSVGIMAAGFPLIRAIGKGGNETLTRGVRDYFERYKRINYNKLSKQGIKGEITARELLKVNVKGGNLNLINEVTHNQKGYTMRDGTPYAGKSELERKASAYKLNEITGEIDGMPLPHVVELLNKMRVGVSKELTSRFKRNYWGDLWESKGRIGTGILFMNYGAFKDGSFDDMSPQELSSHLFMAALMTKGRGAWGHSEAMGYVSREYGDMHKALDFLRVDHKNLDRQLSILTEQDVLDKMNVLYGHNDATEKIVNTFDDIFVKGNIDWSRDSSEKVDLERYDKVRELLSAYNGLKKSSDARYDFIDIEDINNKTLETLRRDLSVIEIGGKSVNNLTHYELKSALGAETINEIRSNYWLFGGQLRENLKIPFVVREDGQGVTARKIHPPNEEVLIPNVNRYNDLLDKHASTLKIDVLSGVDSREKLEKLAADKNMTMEEYDSALGKEMDNFMTSMGEKYRHHNLFLPFEDNIFLNGINTIQSIEAKDDIYKVVTGVESDKNNIITLQEAMLNTFATSEGKLNKNIFDNQIEGKRSKELLEDPDPDITSYLNTIKPVYDLTRELGGRGTTESFKSGIKSGDLKEIAEKIEIMSARLPSDWKLDLYGNAYDVFASRLFSGGNKLTLRTLNKAREEGLVTTKFSEGQNRIVVPEDNAIDNFVGITTTEAKSIKESIRRFESLFKKGMVIRDPLFDPSQPLERWVDFVDQHSNSRIEEFVTEVPKILDNIQQPSAVENRLVKIRELVTDIGDIIRDPNRLKELDPDTLKDLLIEVKTFQETVKRDKLISDESNVELENLIGAMEGGINDFTLQGATYSKDNYDRVITGFDNIISQEVNEVSTSKNNLSNLTIKLENHLTGRDPNLSFSQAKDLYEQLVGGLRDLAAGKLADKEVPLSELVEEFNNNRSWRDIDALLTNVLRTARSYNHYQPTFNNISATLLNELQGDKLGSERPLNFQEMMIEYPSLQSTSDVNKPNDAFIRDINDAVSSRDPAVRVENVFREYIYSDLKDKYPDDIGKADSEYTKFHKAQAEPLINKIFSTTNKVVIQLDHDKLKMVDMPVRRSLSTMTLDRVGTNNPDETYDYYLLTGSMKMDGRLVNMDEAARIGGDWLKTQSLIEKAIPINMDKLEGFYDKAKETQFEITADELRTLTDYSSDQLLESSKVYMRLSPYLRFIFPKTARNIDLLNRDFEEVYSERTNDYRNKPRSLKVLEDTFGDLLRNTSTSNEILRLKMLFVHFNRTMKPVFDEMISELSFGRGTIEYNSFKRGFLADGSTSTILTEEALTWSSRYNQDPLVKDYDKKLLRKGTVTIGVVEDEISDTKQDHFFNNAKILVRKFANRVSPSGNTLQDRLINNFTGEISGGKYKSLESFFMDGGKIAGTGFGASTKAKKGGGGERPDGRDQRWNGIKTTIMHNDLLGKGFTVTDPRITPILDDLGVDLLIGRTVAKTLNLEKVTPFIIDPINNLTTGWENHLRGIDTPNKIEIPYGNIGLAFTSHEGVGVNYSSSMFDFQDIHHTKRAIKLYNIDKIIDDMWNINKNRNLANGELLRALYKIRQDETGQQLSTDNYTLTEELLEMGGRESNPLLQKSVLRLLQSDFYKLITKRATHFGEEGFSAIDADNTLRDPVYATFKTSDTRQTMFGVDKGTYDVAYQYGGGSITNELSRKTLGNDILNDIPIVARDKDSGLDIVYWVDKVGKVSHYSPLMNFQNKAPDVNIKGLNDLERIKVNKKNIAKVEETIVHLHETLKRKVMAATVGDAINLLKGDGYKISGAKRWVAKGARIGLEKKYATIAKDFDIQLGMTLNAIPKVGKDQPLVRIEKVLDSTQNGLSTLNTFDLRVTLQRDFDGDHIYKYLKMPKSMMIDYLNDMGDVTDYKPLENIVINDRINMFGIGKDGKAGSVIGSIGFDRIANEVITKKRVVSGLISRKGTLSYLLNSRLQLNGNSFIAPELLLKNADIAEAIKGFQGVDALGIFQRSGELNQGALDLWKGSPEMAEKLEAISNYYLYGQTGSYKKPSEHHTTRSFFTDEGFGGTKFERGLFNIMHRTLSKARIMDNDTYDAAGQRQPTTAEVSKARRDLRDFYDDPNLFLVRKLMSNARREFKKGNTKERDRIIADIAEYFFPGVLKSRNLDFITSSMKETGEIPVEFMEKKFTFKDGTTDGIKSSVSGYVLDAISKNPIFYDRSNKGETDTQREIITESFNRLYDKVNTLLTFEDYNPDYISDLINREGVLPKNTDPSTGMFDANMRGILKFVADSQYSNQLRNLKLLSRENFPDANKIERAEDRIGTLKVLTDVLDRQMSNDFILDKSKDLHRFFKSQPDEKVNWGYEEFKVSGNLYRIAGDVTTKNLRKPNVSKGIEYVGYVNEGKRKRIRNGYTYLIDTKPVWYKSVDDAEAKWNKAFEKATIMGDLKADLFISPYGDPLRFNEFVADIADLKNGIRESYSKALDGNREKPIYKKDFFYYGDTKTDMLIDSFFEKYKNVYNRDMGGLDIYGMDGLVKYLIQPSIQRNVYWKSGNMEAPYFKMNTHLVESIFKWLKKKRTDTQMTNAEYFSDGRRFGKDIIEDIVKDMNVFHDYTTDALSFKASQYNSMKLSGDENWSRFNTTTAKSLMDDWYHNPVLSNWSKQFYLGGGDLVRKMDSNGKMKTYWDFRGSTMDDPNIERIRNNIRCP